MTLFFPLIYSAIVFLILIIVNVIIFKQIGKFKPVFQTANKLENTITPQNLNVQKMCDIAKIYSYINQYTKTIEIYKLILDRNIKLDNRCKSYIYNLIGLTYLKLNENQNAICYLKNSLIFSPNNNIALMNLKKAYNEIGDTYRLENIKKLELQIIQN